MSKAALLDTHTLLWYSVRPNKLSVRVRDFIRDRRNTIYVSAITAWEFSIKYHLGKLPEAEPLTRLYHQRLAQYGFVELPFTSVHALSAGRLEHPHKDPFDRALVAQAFSERLPIVSSDEVIHGFAGVQTIG